MRLLEGKVAIVTGAGQGIGKSEALYLSKLGAAVVVNDRGRENGKGQSFADQVVNEIKQAGGAAVANYSDVSDWNAAKAMIDQAVGTFGGLDILLCNAGIVRDRVCYNMSEAEWDDVIRVHLKGHFAPTRFAAAYWREQVRQTGKPASGRIIYTSSEAGLFGHFGQVNYASAKAGITGLCLTAAVKLEKFGVTVNTISPRARTPMTEGTFGKFVVPHGQFDEQNPDNIAPWIGFLCTDAAANISGQIFVVYGGTVSLMSPWPTKAEIKRQAAWTIEELVVEAQRIMPGLTARPPDFPVNPVDLLAGSQGAP